MSEKWTLEKKFTFEAAHRLPYHDGKCQRLHGHSWRGAIVVEGTKLATDGPKQGMVCDYADLKRVLAPLIECSLDHHYLNESLGLENPTSEEVARWLYRRLEGLPGLKAVVIEETCTSACRYEVIPTE